MLCKKCGSGRVIHVNAKCSDLCSVYIGDSHQDGYVPDGAPFGDDGGDNVVFDLCLDCGQMAGDWPAAEMEIESLEDDDDEDETDDED